MKLVHVIPISRGITKDRLSYFSKDDIPAGAIVSVPIRNRLSPAIVEKTENVEDVKTKLRLSPFPIKKIEKIQAAELFLPEFMEAIRLVADYTAGTVGAVLNSLTPKVILTAPKTVSGRKYLKKQKGEKKINKLLYEKLIFQTDRDERFATYKSLIREAFARKQSVFICMPTLYDVEKFVAQSEKGIQTYMFSLHSGLAKGEIQDRWGIAIKSSHPVVIVATGSFLSIPRRDIGTIIIERESASSYKFQTRPFVDIRVAANFLAQKLNARIIFADSFLRIETLYEYDEGNSAELAPLRFRPLSSAKHEIINMKNYKPTVRGRYDIISHELARLAEDTKRNSEHLFVWSSRRGLSPITVCSDCGAVVTSSISDAPMVLHKTSRGNIFVSHQDGEIRNAAECCRVCNGWKLVALGAGVQLVEEQLKERFPKMAIYRIDSDSTKTHKQAQGIAEEWYQSPGSILIGTEMALPYITEPIENIAVASIDSLLSIPDFKIETKIFSILLLLRALANKNFLLQTRNPNQLVLKHALGGNVLEFYREELSVRKELQYPPFSLFIKLTVSGKKEVVIEEMKRLELVFKDYDFRVFSAFTPAPYGRQTSHALIKFKKENWPNDVLLEKLRELPPQILVQVEPESIL